MSKTAQRLIAVTPAMEVIRDANFYDLLEVARGLTEVRQSVNDEAVKIVDAIVALVKVARENEDWQP